MPFFSHDSDEAKAYQEVTNAPHKAHLSHEIIAAAASYEAAKAWNDHNEKNGKHPSHAKAKEFLAAASAGFITHLIETKGLDYLDQQKAKKHAEEKVHGALDESGHY